MQKIIYRSSGSVFKNQAFVLFLARAIAATRFMTILGVGTSVNFLRVLFFQIVERRNYMCTVGCMWALSIFPLESASYIVVHLVKLGKGRLAWCDHMRSLITCICLSTSGTWSRAPVVFRVVLTTFSSSDLNSRSKKIVTTCKPYDL